MCRIVQDVGILRFYFSKQKYFRPIVFLSDVTGCRENQVSNCTSYTMYIHYIRIWEFRAMIVTDPCGVNVY
jgi:hypothetical protein